jgi:TolB-like protein/AraC-like DNA-binding protein
MREMGLIERFNEIIDNHLNSQSFDIDEICRELGTSRSQLYRHIKEHSQLSTSLYIRKRKLAKARELLESSDMKTAEIAYHLGIDSPQNFSKYFSQEFGISPTAYRKKIVEEKSNTPEQKLDTVNNPSALPPLLDGDIYKKKSAYKPFAGLKYVYGGIGVLSLLFMTYYFLWRSESDGGSVFGFRRNSIAIMPFKNMGAPETAYYCEGIADQIQGTLSLNEQLKVISTTSSGKYRNSNKLIPQIAKELGVNYILEGSVFESNNKIRINIGLVSVSDDRTVWTKSYDGDTQDLFSYLSNVSREVAKELGQKLSPETRKKLNKVPTTSAAAYKEYLQGSQLVASRQKDRLEESIVRFSNAIEFDPDFADAYASRGHAYYLMGESAFIDEQQSFKMAEQNSLTAIRLDTENALAYANLGNIYRAQYKWEQAKTAYEIALKCNPNEAVVNYWLSLLLRSTGDLKNAIQYSAKATELDPLDHVIFGGHITNCVFGGELQRVEKSIEEGKVLFNDSFVYHWGLSHYYSARQDYHGALESITKALQLNPGIRSTRFLQAYYQGKTGQVETANAYLNNLPDLPENYIARATVYAGLKDQQQSILYLQKAADLGMIPTDVKVSPIFDIHKNSELFKAILQKFNLE